MSKYDKSLLKEKQRDKTKKKITENYFFSKMGEELKYMCNTYFEMNEMTDTSDDY